jgi:site-specific DNA-adenine methylase
MKENVFDNKLIQKQLERIKTVEQNKEEMEKCKDPLYFYNTYVRKENQPELTKEEYNNFLMLIEKRRNGPIKFRGNFMRPLTPEECFKPKENDKIL